MQSQIIKCPKPECQSLDVYKWGYYYQNGKKIQKYKCKKCGHVWIEKQ